MALPDPTHHPVVAGASAPATALSAGDPEAAAQAARLRYTSDERPGYTRRKRGKGFTYLTPEGETVTDERVRRRLEALAIPPAWRDVWICRSPTGHIQATGYDEAGRKQYIYHPRWTEVRDAVKFASLVAFGHSLPRLRRRVNRDLKGEELNALRLTAAAVKLIDLTLTRVGNARYARENGSYGVTTLRNKHVKLVDDTLDVAFRGKSGEKHEFTLENRELAETLRRCQELPGYELFRYRNEDGAVSVIDSEDVNDYLREVTGTELTAKEFRTWGGSVIVAQALAEAEPGPDASRKERKRAAAAAVERAANALGNTPTICRQSYVHPQLLQSFLASEFEKPYRKALRAARDARPRELRLHEAATLAFLEAVGPEGRTGR